jgi:hypothetical protein
MNENEEMDSLYSDKPGAKPAAAKSKPKSIDEQEAQDMAKTALVPLDCLKRKDGTTPTEGETCTVKINAIHGDQAEISYVEPEESEETGDEPAMAGAGGAEDDGYQSMLQE